jgi:hypothetical protein
MGLILKNVNITGGKLSSTSSSSTSTTSTSRSTATLRKSNQTTSYITGDDGDIQAGRVVDFFTLDLAPVHNDGTPTINTTTNRFTDTLGGQTYANKIVLDWSTWDGATLLGYQQDYNEFGSLLFDVAVATALASTLGGYLGWRMMNVVEAFNLCNFDKTFQTYNNPPFINASNTPMHTSTTGTTAASSWRLGATNPITPAAKTTSSRLVICRTFNLSTLNLFSFVS